MQTTNNGPMAQTIDTLIAREDALKAAARANGVDIGGRNALAILRAAIGFLDILSEGIARGIVFDSPEAVQSYQWAVMKLVEFNGMLPEHMQGNLSATCFMPDQPQREN